MTAIYSSPFAENFNLVIVVYGILALVALFIIVAFIGAWPRLKERGAIFGLFTFAFLFAAANKPTVYIRFAEGLRDNGSSVDTNTFASVTFRWIRDPSVIGASQKIYFTYRGISMSDLEFDYLGEVVAGLGDEWTYDFGVAGMATNYEYYVYAMTGVHTNGVWLGNVIDKPYRGGGIDQMVPIKSSVEVDGEKITPEWTALAGPPLTQQGENDE